ncbi:uncharacterized protein [Physcomitrium patens]|uniref:Uncharacterized protein n=1 Tax=Physcomitrium patens TaxID=3218 RepID=A0A2K1KE44_PHYPA|nr:uncharacterized protein LOC112283641 [Physcomitrium patens]XP_024378426.1 uncharacterized protein LOC112283641 [Physcomitrium patens]PNR52052.1 hypothetical protein PHYPA_008426 [Physcomitrium patens]|eukprot:XP_024378425.1 uncharacterized protein LOC112283641 [Physcomitrella patens]
MKVITVCMLLLYLCLGALAAYFGFSAKHTSGTREYHVLLYKDICIYPDSPAQTTGLLAGLILLVAQMLVIATCACTCRWNDKKQVEGLNATIIGLGCILGCFASGLAAAFFASGSALSRPAERYRVREKTNTSADCAQPKFTTAIALLFVAVFLGFIFFVGIVQEARKGVLTTPLPQTATVPTADPENSSQTTDTTPPGPDRLPV